MNNGLTRFKYKSGGWVSPLELRDRLLLVCVLIAVLAIGVGCLPVSVQRYHQHAAILELVGDSKERFWSENYRELKEEKVVKANYLKSREEKLSFSDELHRFVQDFRQISEYSGVEMTGFNFGGMTKKEEYALQAMELSVCGTYNGILTFLQVVNQGISCQKFDFTITPLAENLQCTVKLEVTLKPGKRGG